MNGKQYDERINRGVDKMKQELEKLINKEISFHKKGGAFLYGRLISVEDTYIVVEFNSCRQIHTIDSLTDVYEAFNSNKRCC